MKAWNRRNKRIHPNWTDLLRLTALTTEARWLQERFYGSVGKYFTICHLVFIVELKASLLNHHLMDLSCMWCWPCSISAPIQPNRSPCHVYVLFLTQHTFVLIQNTSHRSSDKLNHLCPWCYFCILFSLNNFVCMLSFSVCCHLTRHKDVIKGAHQHHQHLTVWESLRNDTWLQCLQHSLCCHWPVVQSINWEEYWNDPSRNWWAGDTAAGILWLTLASSLQPQTGQFFMQFQKPPNWTEPPDYNLWCWSRFGSAKS